MMRWPGGRPPDAKRGVFPTRRGAFSRHEEGRFEGFTSSAFPETRGGASGLPARQLGGGFPAGCRVSSWVPGFQLGAGCPAGCRVSSWVREPKAAGCLVPSWATEPKFFPGSPKICWRGRRSHGSVAGGGSRRARGALTREGFRAGENKSGMHAALLWSGPACIRRLGALGQRKKRQRKIRHAPRLRCHWRSAGDPARFRIKKPLAESWAIRRSPGWQTGRANHDDLADGPGRAAAVGRASAGECETGNLSEAWPIPCLA